MVAQGIRVRLLILPNTMHDSAMFTRCSVFSFYFPYLIYGKLCEWLTFSRFGI